MIDWEARAQALQSNLDAAHRLLDVPNADPDDDVRTMARNFIRAAEHASSAEADFIVADAMRKIAETQADELEREIAGWQEQHRCLFIEYEAMRARAEAAEAALVEARKGARTPGTVEVCEFGTDYCSLGLGPAGTCDNSVCPLRSAQQQKDSAL